MMTPIRVGQIGAGFIGRVHSLAYRNAASANHPVGAPVDLHSIVASSPESAARAARQYGWRNALTDWRTVVSDPDVVLVANAGPNHLHEDPCVAAARNAKPVFCEKPLAPTADAAYRLWRNVAETGVLHQCGLMYRFIPALVLARDLIRAGELGDIRHFRARFLLSYAADQNLPLAQLDPHAGALGDLGSHHVDLARFLVAEVDSVAAALATYLPDRPGGTVTTDDACVALARLANGALATFEASRVAGNHTLTSRIEIDGSRGSLSFDFERLNELRVALRRSHGFRTILVTQPGHPFSDFRFPDGLVAQHPIGWADCFAHQAHCMLSAIAQRRPLPPDAPTFADGYRVAEIIETMIDAASERTWLDVHYRTLDQPARSLHATTEH